MPSPFHSTCAPTWSDAKDEKCSKENAPVFQNITGKALPSLTKLETIPEDAMDAIITSMRETELGPGCKKDDKISNKFSATKSIELTVHATPTSVYTCLSDPRPLELKHLFQANPSLLDAISNALESGVQLDTFTKVLYTCRSTVPDWPWVHRLASFLYDVPPLFESFLQMIGWVGGRISLKNINPSSITPGVCPMAVRGSRYDPPSFLPCEPLSFNFLGLNPPMSTPQTLRSYQKSSTLACIKKRLVNGESGNREDPHAVAGGDELSHFSALLDPTLHSTSRSASIPCLLKTKPALASHLDGTLKKRTVMIGSPMMSPVCSKLVASHFSISATSLPIPTSPLIKAVNPSLSVPVIANAEEGSTEKSSSANLRSIRNGS